MNVNSAGSAEVRALHETTPRKSDFRHALRGRCPATPYELNKIQRKSPNIKVNRLKSAILMWKFGFETAAAPGLRVFSRREGEPLTV
jgi:hypothetical protein